MPYQTLHIDSAHQPYAPHLPEALSPDEAFARNNRLFVIYAVVAAVIAVAGAVALSAI